MEIDERTIEERTIRIGEEGVLLTNISKWDILDFMTGRKELVFWADSDSKDLVTLARDDEDTILSKRYRSLTVVTQQTIEDNSEEYCKPSELYDAANGLLESKGI